MGRLVILAAALAGCAEGAGAGPASGAVGSAGHTGGGRDNVDGVAGGPEIGLRRGYAWSSLTVRPPHIIGPNATLLLKDSVLSGAIAGSRMSVKINSDGADGYGPIGPVMLNFTKKIASVEVNGTWNGFRVHFDFAEDSLRGTVVNSGNPGFVDPRRIEFGLLGAPQGPGIATYATCEYVLTELGKDGALTGTSTCGGMPEQTRLEVPRIIRAYLTRPELVVVLVAFLSAPEIVASESVTSPG